MRNCSQKVSTALAVFAVSLTAHAGHRKQENIKVETRVVKETLPSITRYEFSRSVGKGRLVKAHVGKEGSVRRTYRVTLSGGKAVSKELLKEERVAPEPTLFLMGRSGFDSSRGSFVRGKVLNMVATAYHSMVCGTGRTRTGRRAAYGVVAVDPRVIPLGTLVYAEGYGFALACDTGGAIKGKRIDLCYESLHTANAYGVRPIKVHILR